MTFKEEETPSKVPEKKILFYIMTGVCSSVLLFFIVIGMHFSSGKNTSGRVYYETEIPQEGISEGLETEAIQTEEQVLEETEAPPDYSTYLELSGIDAGNSPFRDLRPPKDMPFEITILFDKDKEHLSKEDTSWWRMEKQGEIVWDDIKIYSYFETLKRKYDVTGDVKFVTHSGRTIYFKSKYCNWSLNTDFTVAQFKEAVTEGKETMNPAWNSGLIYCSDNGVGKKYLEVDISEQKVYLIENEEEVFVTDCVTGVPDGIHDTIRGVYQIQYKASPSILIDEDKTYEQEVNYWLPFNGTQGLHDAVWRVNFGGDIYLTNGSHGCVNLPLESAERIYKEVYMFYPVIVY